MFSKPLRFLARNNMTWAVWFVFLILIPVILIANLFIVLWDDYLTKVGCMVRSNFESVQILIKEERLNK